MSTGVARCSKWQRRAQAGIVMTRPLQEGREWQINQLGDRPAIIGVLENVCYEDLLVP